MGSILEIDTGAEGVREKGSIYALDVGPGLIASGGPNQIVTLWDPRSGNKINNLIGHTDLVRSVLIDALGDTLLTASSDNTVKVWSTKSFKCINTLYMHEASVWSLHSTDRHLRVFHSADSSGVVAKTDIRYADMYANDGASVAVAHEHGGVVSLVGDGGDIWTGTSRPCLNRWTDVNLEDLTESHGRKSSAATYRAPRHDLVQSDPQAFPPEAILSLTSIVDVELTEEEASRVVPIRPCPSETIVGASGIVRARFLKDRRSVLSLDTEGEVALWDVLQVSGVGLYKITVHVKLTITRSVGMSSPLENSHSKRYRLR